ncbi:MAG: threonine-phosphate decarboxylase CobD [Bacteroidota bacterium]
MIEGHGDDLHKYGDIRANFSSNVNPEGPPPALIEHLRDSISSVACYPEPKAGNLARQIEKADGLDPNTVLITSGAVEAFYLLADWLAGKRSLIYTPSFSEYEDACQLAGHEVFFRDHWHFEEDDQAGMDVVWICNPNNPDGRMYGPETICHRLEENPETLFVVDEAYVDFTQEEVSLIDEVRRFPNLVVVRSMTKRFAIPGLRLGYLVADREVTEALKQKLMPWRINALALEAGLFCMSDTSQTSFDATGWISESRRLQQKLDKLEGFRVQPSETVFFIVEGPVKAAEIKEQLAREDGLLIRDASNFRGLSQNHFRVCVQTPDKNEWLIEALKKWS